MLNITTAETLYNNHIIKLLLNNDTFLQIFETKLQVAFGLESLHLHHVRIVKDLTAK